MRVCPIHIGLVGLLMPLGTPVVTRLAQGRRRRGRHSRSARGHARSGTPDTSPPSIPTGLTASAISCTETDLAWDASTDVGGSGLKGYNIYRNGAFVKQVITSSTAWKRLEPKRSA